MNKIDISKLSREQYINLVEFLSDIRDKAFSRTREVNHVKDIVEDYLDLSYKRLSAGPLRIDEGAGSSSGDSLDRLPSNLETDLENEADEFIVLRDNFLLRKYFTLQRKIKNSNLHPSNEWFGLDRNYIPYLKDTNLNEFASKANLAIINYFTKENKRYNFRQKYAKGIPEFIAHGYTVGLHYWNSKDSICDIIHPSTRNFGMFPFTDDTKNNNKVIKHQINYFDLLHNAKYDQGFIAQYIKPSSMQSGKVLGEYDRCFIDTDEATYGQVMLTWFSIPVLYIEGMDDEDPLIYRDCIFEVLFSPEKTSFYQEDKPLGENVDHIILYGASDCETFETGEYIGSCTEAFPLEFPPKGTIASLMYDQIHLNTLKQSHVRWASYVGDPAISIRNSSGDPLDIDDLDNGETQELTPGKRFIDKVVEVLIPPEVAMIMNQLVNSSKVLTDNADQVDSISKNASGQPLSGKRSATEVDLINSGSTEAEMDIVQQYDDQVLKTSMGVRQSMTFNQLFLSVADAILDDDYSQEDAEEILLDDKYKELIIETLSENKLYQRIKNWSEIELMYEEYYEEYMYRYEEDQEIYTSMQDLQTRIESIKQELNQDYNPQNIQQEDAMRMQKMADLNNLQMTLDDLISKFEDLEPIPEPNDYLYFRILVSPIANSDIDITAGTAVSRLKQEKEVYDMMLDYGSKIPAMGIQLDYEKIVKQLSKILKHKPTDFLKTPAALQKDKDNMQAQAPMPGQAATPTQEPGVT